MPLEDNLTPEQQAEVQALHAAFRQEFSEGLDESKSKGALNDLDELKPNMLAALKRALDQHDDKRLAANVAMWGYGKLIDQNKATADPLTELLEGAPDSSAKKKSKRS